MTLETEYHSASVPPSASHSPSEQIMGMITGCAVSQICGTVARLGLADHLKDGARSVPELASLTSADPDGLVRLLRAAATVGLFSELEDGRFELTALGAELSIGDSAGSFGDLAIAWSAPGFWLPHGRLFDAVISGGTQVHEALGKEMWAYYAEHPAERRHFARAMSSISAQASRTVARHYDARRFRRIVDVGGSHGALLLGLLARVPAARGVLFDLPEVIDGACETMAASGRADRVELVGGDFFEQVPAGGDLYLLKSILHDWDDEPALEILRNIHRASAPGATLAVIEGLLPSRPAPSQLHLANLLMLVQVGGRERTLKHYTDLLEQAGFQVQRTIPAPSPPFPWTVIEARRA